MNTRKAPEDLVWELTRRVQLRGRKQRYQMAALIVDRAGRVVSWGWAHYGPQGSVHAEIHALRRANPKRLPSKKPYSESKVGTPRLLVAGRRVFSERALVSRPCQTCLARVSKAGIKCISYLTPNGWQQEEIQ